MMLEESFLMKAYRSISSMEVQVGTKEIEDFPDDDAILDFIAEFNADRVEVVKSYKTK